MKLVDTTCPYCGSALKVDPANKNATCEYCGGAMLIDDEVQHIQYDNAEKAGYEFEKGRQRAQAEAIFNSNQSYTQQYQQATRIPKKKRRTWLWVLGWIFIFPVPLTILMLKNQKLNKGIRIGIIAIAWIVYLLIGLSGNSSENQNEAEQSVSSTIIDETLDKTNDAIQDIPQEEAEEAVSTAESDMDVILRAGHPTYYGSVERSHEVWDDIEAGRIHFGDKSYGYNDNPILSMSSYRNSDTIRQIIINFVNFKEDTSVPIEEALEIVASYMPYEIMDQYYEYKGSEMIVPDESREDDAVYYIISYRLTEEGSSAYYAKDHDYSGTIDVIIQVNDDIVQNIDITFGTPRWMSSLSQNNYHKEDWLCDLYDYRH